MSGPASQGVVVMLEYDWSEHFGDVPEDVRDRFVYLNSAGCAPILEQRGLARAAGVQLTSAENRVFVFDDVVLKVFRPGRWSQGALEDEVVFLEDLRAAGVSAVRPIGSIQCWEGLYHLAYEHVGESMTEDRAVLCEADVERLVRLIADVHRVGAQRVARHRPRMDPLVMSGGLLRVIDERGHLPARVASRYKESVRGLCEELDDLLRGVPHQRIHADLGTWNVAWRGDEPVLMDLDDFQVGPVALDVRLASFPWRLDRLPESMEYKERRAIQQELIIARYRDHLVFPETWTQLFRPLSMLRGVVFDAWFSRNWDEPLFREHYPDDDITDEQYWIRAASAIEGWLERA